MASVTRSQAAAPPFPFPNRPEPSIAWVWGIRGLAFPLIYAVPLSFMFFSIFLRSSTSGTSGDQNTSWIMTVVIVFLSIYAVVAAVSFAYAFAAARRFSFEVHEDEVVVRKGVLFRTTSRIPLRKVQDVHVRQGPLLRAFGLASVKLDTAGGFTPARSGRGLMSEGEMPGIRNADAVAEALIARVKAIRSDL